MEWIYKIAFYRNIRNEVPNQELAKELANSNNMEGIKEIVGYLHDKNQSISSDCLKVLYEVGYLKPDLIVEYVDTFLELLSSKNNRMVWGGMIALSTISKLKADSIYRNIDLVLETMKQGTLITEVWGINTLVGVSLQKKQYKDMLFPILCNYLEKCRAIDFAKRVDTIMPVISNSDEKEIIERIIMLKKHELSETQKKKLLSVIRRYNKN